ASPLEAHRHGAQGTQRGQGASTRRSLQADARQNRGETQGGLQKVKYRVTHIPAAQNDILEIHRYLELHDGKSRADQVFDAIDQAAASLSGHPMRGHIPPELRENSDDSVREIHYKPYRIVYKVFEWEVTVLLVADGRRDFRTLLTERLL